MNRATKALKITLSIVATLLIGLATALFSRPVPEPISTYYAMFGVMALVSVVWLHYAIDDYLLPLQAFAPELRADLVNAATQGHRASFFSGTLWLGYLLIGLDLMAYFSMPGEDSAGTMLVLGLALIVLGLLARARGTLLYLARVTRDHRGESNESAQ